MPLSGCKSGRACAIFIVMLLACVGQVRADARGEQVYRQGSGAVAACISCHGPRGSGGGDGQFPALAGLPRQYILGQLAAFSNGRRHNAVMAPVAQQLSPGDADAVATWLSALVPDVAPEARANGVDADTNLLVTMGDTARGLPACITCHGAALQGGGPFIPGLTGQRSAYISNQLTAFATGTRSGKQGIMASIAKQLKDEEMVALAGYIASLEAGTRPSPVRGKSDWKITPQDPARFIPPPESSMPVAGDFGRVLLLGERVFDNTPQYAQAYAGNGLSCRNCHLARGRNAASSPLWAAVTQYPKYRRKNKRVNDLTMRIQGCFIYSENGAAPPADSDVMVALVTYAHWLASGMPLGVTAPASGYPKLADPALAPDPARGEQVYRSNCAMCHGDDGAGRIVAGERVFPALWGSGSFNWGAGMHRVNTAAAFIKAVMPLGKGGSLTDQQAWDVAAWMNSHSRPQDPRYQGDTDATRRQFHANHPYDYYGKAGVTR